MAIASLVARHLSLFCFVAVYLVSLSQPARGLSANERTDANLVTAIDVSDSIGRHEEWLQQTGLVRALRHPDFLRAATAGRYRRIGFAVFTWSSDGNLSELVPWTIISSSEDAARISAALASITLIDRTHYGGGDMEQKHDDREVAIPDRLTDLSAAIDFAAGLLSSAPYRTRRSVMNICGNGVDNVADGPEAARARALSKGLTINGLAVGQNEKVVQYFRSQVIGGPGAFVMELTQTDDPGTAMVTKFARDLRISSIPANIEQASRPGWNQRE